MQTPIFNWNFNYTLNEQSFQEGNPNNQGSIQIYTDGSKIDDGPTGYGTFIIQAATQTTISEYGNLGLTASVFQGEIYAVTRAASALLTQNTINQDIQIFIDSQAPLKALANPQCSSHTVHESRSALNTLGAKNNITLNWVKAHVGHKMNEEADKLAKLGTACNNLHSVPTPIKHYYHKIAQRTHAMWRRRWKAEPSCRQTRQMLPEPNEIFSKYLISLPRQDTSLLLQFITGHNYLNYHLFNTQRSITPTCRLCHESDETSWHILAECPRLFMTRCSILCAWVIEKLPHPKAILEFLKSPQISPLLSITETSILE